MQDFLSTITLISAALVSLALGVLLAYAVCRLAFAALRLHAGSLAAEASAVKPQVAQVS